MQYCWAWDQYLCANCRLKRNDAEIRISLKGWPEPSRPCPANQSCSCEADVVKSAEWDDTAFEEMLNGPGGEVANFIWDLSLEAAAVAIATVHVLPGTPRSGFWGRAAPPSGRPVREGEHPAAPGLGFLDRARLRRGECPGRPDDLPGVPGRADVPRIPVPDHRFVVFGGHVLVFDSSRWPAQLSPPPYPDCGPRQAAPSGRARRGVV